MLCVIDHVTVELYEAMGLAFLGGSEYNCVYVLVSRSVTCFITTTYVEINRSNRLFIL